MIFLTLTKNDIMIACLIHTKLTNKIGKIYFRTLS
jgi:hypothetical protein